TGAGAPRGAGPVSIRHRGWASPAALSQVGGQGMNCAAVATINSERNQRLERTSFSRNISWRAGPVGGLLGGKGPTGRRSFVMSSIIVQANAVSPALDVIV